MKFTVDAKEYYEVKWKRKEVFIDSYDNSSYDVWRTSTEYFQSHDEAGEKIRKLKADKNVGEVLLARWWEM